MADNTGELNKHVALQAYAAFKAAYEGHLRLNLRQKAHEILKPYLVDVQKVATIPA